LLTVLKHSEAQQFHFIVYSFVYQPDLSSNYIPVLWSPVSVCIWCHSLQATQNLQLLQHPVHYVAEAKYLWKYLYVFVCIISDFGMTHMQVHLKTDDSGSHLLCCVNNVNAQLLAASKHCNCCRHVVLCVTSPCFIVMILSIVAVVRLHLLLTCCVTEILNYKYSLLQQVEEENFRDLIKFRLPGKWLLK